MEILQIKIDGFGRWIRRYRFSLVLMKRASPPSLNLLRGFFLALKMARVKISTSSTFLSRQRLMAGACWLNRTESATGYTERDGDKAAR